MPQEKLTYRDNLDRLCERFPDREFLTVKDVMDFSGKSRNTIVKLFPFKKGIGISKASRVCCRYKYGKEHSRTQKEVLSPPRASARGQALTQ